MPDEGLERFVIAQDERGTYERALQELREGRKVTHWMWFVFPQIAGLGESATSRHFAIRSLTEARAYVDHPVLGRRLRECASVLLDQPETDAVAIFGSIDARKLRSSMTLFHRAAPDDPIFGAALHRYFDDQADEATDRLLTAGHGDT